MSVFNKDKIDYFKENISTQRNEDAPEYYNFLRESMQQMDSVQHQQHLNGGFSQTGYGGGQSISQLVQQQSRQQIQTQMGIPRAQQQVSMSSTTLGNSDNNLQYLNPNLITRNHGGIASLNAASGIGMYGSNGIVRTSSNEYSLLSHQYAAAGGAGSGVSRIPPSNSAPQFDSAANFPLLSSSTSISGKGTVGMGYSAIVAMNNSNQPQQQSHRLNSNSEDEFALENEDFPALPGTLQHSSKATSEQHTNGVHPNLSSSLSSSTAAGTAADRLSLQQQDSGSMFSTNGSSAFSLSSLGGTSNHIHHSTSQSSNSGPIQGVSNISNNVNSSNNSDLLSGRAGSSLLSGGGVGGMLDFAPGSSTGPSGAVGGPALANSTNNSKEAKFGLLGLLEIIRYTDKELNVLALGTDLTTFGLNLNAADSLYPSFTSPFSESTSSQPEPPVNTPPCYLMHPPSLKTEHLSKFQLETLFYMFYSMPKDILQSCAAQELYRRDWRFHSELRLWLKPRSAQELMQNHPSVQFIYFEVSAWETRLFTTSAGPGRGNLAQGLLSEEDVRVKAPQPNSAPLLAGGPVSSTSSTSSVSASSLGVGSGPS